MVSKVDNGPKPLGFFEDTAKEAVKQINTGLDQSQRAIDVVNECAEPPRLMQPLGQRVSLFVKAHPMITKIFFYCHIFSLIGIVTTLPALYKHGKRFCVRSGMERFDAAMKVLARLGDIAASVATAAIGFEAFKFGEKLASAGLTPLAEAYRTVGRCLDMIIIVGTVLSVPMMIIDARKWWKSRTFLKNLESKEWYRESNSERKYALLKAYLQNLQPQDIKLFSKHLGVKGAAFRKALLDRLQSDKPTESDLRQMSQEIERMTGRLKVGKTFHLVSSLSWFLYLSGAACLLVPVLHPLAAVLLVASSVSYLVITIFDQVHRYRFEDQLGLINRSGGHTPKNLRERLVDYTKWQIGWYEEGSLLKRLMNVGSNVTENTLLVSEALSSMLRACTVFGRIMS